MGFQGDLGQMDFDEKTLSYILSCPSESQIALSIKGMQWGRD